MIWRLFLFTRLWNMSLPHRTSPSTKIRQVLSPFVPFACAFHFAQTIFSIFSSFLFILRGHSICCLPQNVGEDPPHPVSSIPSRHYRIFKKFSLEDMFSFPFLFFLFSFLYCLRYYICVLIPPLTSPLLMLLYPWYPCPFVMLKCMYASPLADLSPLCSYWF